MGNDRHKTGGAIFAPTTMGIIMDFKAFPKIARLSRDVIVTEKIDGTNAQIFIGEDGSVLAGSRTRWITPADDNFGFAAWVEEHREELLGLGPGRHFGEWWGKGIQRNYGLQERRFSLFNALRWAAHGEDLREIPSQDPRITPKMQERPPMCCEVVYTMFRGAFDTIVIDECLAVLRRLGSATVPGFMKPEGVVVFHIAGNVAFKKTLDKDDEPKFRRKS